MATYKLKAKAVKRSAIKFTTHLAIFTFLVHLLFKCFSPVNSSFSLEMSNVVYFITLLEHCLCARTVINLHLHYIRCPLEGAIL